jgi:hypothetical protein
MKAGVCQYDVSFSIIGAPVKTTFQDIASPWKPVNKNMNKWISWCSIKAHQNLQNETNVRRIPSIPFPTHFQNDNSFLKLKHIRYRVKRKDIAQMLQQLAGLSHKKN